MSQPYVPPGDGEPLDDIQEALLRALVPMLVEEICEALAAQQPERLRLVERHTDPDGGDQERADAPPGAR